MDVSKGYSIYEFRNFRVDIRKRQLFKDESPVQLTAKAFDTLVALLDMNGETVSKGRLMDIIWPETAVEENNLTQQISALRKALGERASDHKFIVTVPGRGYCFVADIRKPDADESIETKRSQVGLNEPPRMAGIKSSAWFGYSVAMVYVLVVCIPAFVLNWRAEMNGTKPQSIAILQFRSSGVGDELLGMGIRDTLTAKLGSLDDVTVRPGQSRMTENVVDAGRQLDVDLVVTGSIQHDDDKVRVAIEMVDISNERIMWGSTFDNDLSRQFELQDSITTAVLSALKRLKNSSSLRTLFPADATPEVREFATVRTIRPFSRLDDPEISFFLRS